MLRPSSQEWSEFVIKEFQQFIGAFTTTEMCEAMDIDRQSRLIMQMVARGETWMHIATIVKEADGKPIKGGPVGVRHKYTQAKNKILKALTRQARSIQDVSIKDAVLSDHTKRILLKNKIETLPQLLTYSKKELLAIKHLGPTTLGELVKFVAVYGRTL